jgi:UDP-N-acetylmuramyl-tripeptide synthetase
MDYHGSLANYSAAKRRLFERLDGVAYAILNSQEPVSKDYANATGAQVFWYGINGGDVRAERLRLDATGSTFELVLPDGRYDLRLPLAGRFNVSNALAAAAAAWALGVGSRRIVAGLHLAKPVAGRLEPVVAGQPYSVLVDYAHTPDALEAVLSTLRPLVHGKLILVFGCGGDRDRGKRALMGAVARRWADITVLTTDNPRSEDPIAICDEVAVAFADGGELIRAHDRHLAIDIALTLAHEPNDLVLIAGKGHEQVQQLRDRVLRFDDREVARQLLTARCGGVIPQ